MSQTKKRSEISISASEFFMPDWNLKQREDFIVGIKIHGLKKLRKLQRHIGTKTQEDIRIAIEYYKKLVQERELSMEIDRLIEHAGLRVDTEYEARTPLHMRSQSDRDATPEQVPDQSAPRLRPPDRLSLPNWRRAEIEDFQAIVHLGPTVITNKSEHIPTKNELEINAATETYTIITQTIKYAEEHKRPVPTMYDLRPGYLYLQIMIGALSENKKLKEFKIPPNADPDMDKAQFVLKEYLMPNVGILPEGWTADEKYSLIVALEAYGTDSLQRIQSYVLNKTMTEIKIAINAIKDELACNEVFYEKSRNARYESVFTWSKTFSQCTEMSQKVVAADRLIFAVRALPVSNYNLEVQKVYQQNLSPEETSAALKHLRKLDAEFKCSRLQPLLQLLVEDVKEELAIRASRSATVASDASTNVEASTNIEESTNIEASTNVEESTNVDKSTSAQQ